MYKQYVAKGMDVFMTASRVTLHIHVYRDLIDHTSYSYSYTPAMGSYRGSYRPHLVWFIRSPVAVGKCT